MSLSAAQYGAGSSEPKATTPELLGSAQNEAMEAAHVVQRLERLLLDLRPPQPLPVAESKPPSGNSLSVALDLIHDAHLQANALLTEIERLI